jgi:hypothetical protein
MSILTGDQKYINLSIKTVADEMDIVEAASAIIALNGTIDINGGGTGQITAVAGFDALSPTTTEGDISYRNATVNARLAPNATATKMFLQETSSVPIWAALVDGDIPATFTSSSTTTFGNKLLGDSITTGKALEISADALTTGKAVDVTSTSTSTATRAVVNVAAVADTVTGTRSGVTSTVTGTGTKNTAITAVASGGTANYALEATGDVTIAGVTAITGATGITGAVTITGAVGITGVTTNTGAVNVTGLTTVTGSVKAIAAATQDAVVLTGRAGGTGSYAATITPGTLTANISLTTPVVGGTIARVYRTSPAAGTGTYVITHGLGIQPVVQAYLVADGVVTAPTSITHDSATQTTVVMGSAAAWTFVCLA